MKAETSFTDDVFAEKSLFEVLVVSMQIAPSKFNVWVMRASIAIAALYVIANALTGVDNAAVISAIQRLSGGIITVTTAILGFLIAGFSIFVSATPISIFKMLIATRYEQSDISYFKQIMFNFLNVFTIYLIGMVVALVVNTLTPLGLMPVIKFEISYGLVSTLNSFVVAGMSVMAIYLILRLKSFIWNMYQSLLVNIALSTPS